MLLGSEQKHFSGTMTTFLEIVGLFCFGAGNPHNSISGALCAVISWRVWTIASVIISCEGSTKIRGHFYNILRTTLFRYLRTKKTILRGLTDCA